MRSLAFLTLMMLAAASGFTRYSDSTSMHVAENTSDCHVNFLTSTQGKDRSFITIDSSQPMIMTDPNGDSDKDGVINLLDIFPDDPDRWFDFSSLHMPEETEAPGPMNPRDLETRAQ